MNVFDKPRAEPNNEEILEKQRIQSRKTKYGILPIGFKTNTILFRKQHLLVIIRQESIQKSTTIQLDYITISQTTNITLRPNTQLIKQKN